MPDAYAPVDADVPAVAVQPVQGCLVVPVQIELYEATLDRLRSDLLDAIQETGLLRIVLDLRGVTLLDRYALDHLRDTLRMAAMMGAEAVYAGIGPGVASCLVDLDPQLCVRVAGTADRRGSGIRVAANVQEALRWLGTGQPNHPPVASDPGLRPGSDTKRSPSRRRPRLVDSGLDPVAALLPPSR